jgi:YhcH/YjgK/YiaL family protein
MLYGRLQGWRTIEGVQGLEPGFEFLERADLPTLPDGRHTIRGDEVYALIMRAPSKAPAAAQFESHHDYVDIQYLISGDEVLGVLPLGELMGATPYDPEKDVAFHVTPPTYPTLRLPPGHFAVFFPTDGHQPMCHAGTPGQLHKAVVKVKVSHWEATRMR